MNEISRTLSWFSRAAVIAAMVIGAAPTNADEPLLITYGRDAAALEGDHDHRQVVQFSVPDDADATVYLRVFDPDAGGLYDTIFGASWPVEGDTETRFAVFGGDGAESIPTDPRGIAEDAELSSGTLLFEATFGSAATYDGKWHTLAALDPAAGELRDGQRVFRLLVEGLSGDEGNLYDIFLSADPDRNADVEGARLYAYVPSVRVPRDDVLTEARFVVPPGAESLTLHHFDASRGDVSFTTNFRSVDLETSGQGAWESTDIALNRWDAGRAAAVTIAGGLEIPNDVTVYAADDSGALIPFELPVRMWQANQRPDAVATITPRSCRFVALSAAASSDPEGNELAYAWHFHDGRILNGRDVTRTYLEPGTYGARLEVTDASGLVANGQASDFEIFVKPQPIARGHAAQMVARGVPVTFDGSASTSQDQTIARYIWSFPDGTETLGESITHVFEEPGIYTIGLRVEDDTDHPCNWAATEVTLTVNARPIAVAGEDLHVAIGEEITFDGTASSDPDGPLIAHNWSFGDDSGADGATVSHAYEAAGIYQVELSVRDDAGVANSAAVDGFQVVVNAPPWANAGDDLVVAVGDVVTLDATSSRDRDGSLIGFAWDLGDGAQDSGAIIQHAYAAPGTFEVTLTVSDDSGVANAQTVDTAIITVNAQPLAEAGAEQRVSVGETVTLDGTASTDPDGGELSYVWNLGDGSWAHESIAEHAYAIPGEYLARLTVTDPADVANSAATDVARIIVNARPVARAGDDFTIAAGKLFVFDGTSSSDPDGHIVSYAWDFGDGGSATSPKPVHSFARPGTYQVTMQVTDNSTTDTDGATDTLTVTVTDAPNTTPSARAGDDVTAIVGEIIHFDASGSEDPSGNLIGYEWDFGDGNGAIGPEPSYAYVWPGDYDVTLTVRDDSGLANDLHSDTLKVTILDRPNADPVAIAGPNLAVSVGEVIAFDGTRSSDPDGNLTAFDWSFGDGSQAIGPTPQHAYERPGTYEVALAVRDDSGLANEADMDLLAVVVNQPPVAEAGALQHVTTGLVQFNGTGSHDEDGVVIRYAWNFGDGGVGSGARPHHVYREAGIYDVTLTVTDDSGTSTSTAVDTTTITVNAAPIADAGPDLVGAPGEQLVFSGDGSLDPDGAVSTYMWDFRDGTTATGPVAVHSYDEPGTYYVRLSIQDDSHQDGAVDYSETKVLINAAPTADAGHDLRAAPGAAITFDGANSFDPDGTLVSYRWDFSDQNAPTDGVTVSRVFETPGSYTAQLTVVDDSGAINGISEAEISILINHQPVAEAGRNQDTSELTIVFDGSGSADADGDGLTYAWSFGDETTATGVRVVHTYASGGTYPVQLVVDDGTGLDNSSSHDSLIVGINRSPIADAGENLRACTNDVVSFNGAGSSDPDGGTLRYDWDFGDGTRSEIPTPSRVFGTAGFYAVTLTVQDESGLQNSRHSDRIMVRIDQAPIADAGPDMLACVNTDVHFDGSRSTDIDGVVNQFSWDFGDGIGGAGNQPTHSYPRPGQYRTVLTIQGDDLGLCANTAFDEVFVNVIPAAQAIIAAPDAAAMGEAVSFDGSSSSYAAGEILGWSWDFGDGATGEGAMIEHAYVEPGTYRVTMALESDAAVEACRIIEAHQLITINAPPLADAGEDRTVAVNDAIRFDASASSDPDGGIVSYAWNFGDGQAAEGVQVRHRFATPGRYDVVLTVTDDSGTQSAEVTDQVHVVVNAAPVADAGTDIRGAPGEQLSFSAGSSFDPDGDVSAFHWDFGDGTSAVGVDVMHAYELPGIYHVHLSVIDATGLENAANHAQSTVVINARPVAYAGPDVRVAPGDPVELSGAYSYDPDGGTLTYHWQFSDGGAVPDETAITRSFDTPGQYTATLVVTDDSGTINGTGSDELVIAVNHAPVAAAGDDAHIAALTVVFDGSGSSDADGDHMTYLWNFGDGQTATGIRVVHTYGAGGIYPVVLTVDDGSGLHNASARDAADIRINRSPVAIAGDSRRACTNDVVLFDGSASNDADSGVLGFRWTFGDGTESTLVNPTKSFDAAGIYTVTLSVEDDAGLPNSTHSDRIVVRVDQAPIAAAGPDIIACVNTDIEFDGTASTDLDGVVNSYAWDFGDGIGGAGDRPLHSYSQPGRYTVKLSVEGDQIGQCSASASDELFVEVVEAPVARISASDASPVGTAVAFDGSGSQFAAGTITGWQWDFGDGTTAEGAQVEHVFAEPGVYQVSLSLDSDANLESCRVVQTRHFISINAAPVADAGENRMSRVDEEILFDASGSGDVDGGIAEYVWDFGDGTVEHGIQVRHIYRSPGSYDVVLRVKDNTDLGNSISTDVTQVTVSDPAGPAIDGPRVACSGDAVSWRALDADGAGTQRFTWLLGDGVSVEGPQVEHRYDRAGRYNVTLFVDDTSEQNRGTRHGTRNLHVNQSPHAVAGPDQLACPGDTVSFDASGSSDADGLLSTWRWDFGDGTSAEGQTIEHAFETPGTYEVSLTVEDDSGATCNAATDTMQVVVNAPPSASAGADRSVWVGGANDVLELDGSASSDPDGDALSFFWEFEDGTLLFGERLRYVLFSAGEMPVTLTVSDTSGLPCGTSQDTAVINVQERQ